jgi:NAD(P)-dependent dehydrogenase (short-subunit alcohol dehydrogenase family)
MNPQRMLASPISRRGMLSGSAAVASLAVTPLLSAQTPQAVHSSGVLITGTSSGFGRLMAEGFARHGATVIATMREVDGKNAPAAAELRALAGNEGLSVNVVEIDVLDERSVTAGVARAIEIAGRIDILVNNAGVVVPGPIELQPQRFFQANIETNAAGAMRVIRAIVPHMRAVGQGTIIQMSSALGRAIDPMLGGYCASKLAVEAAADALSYELAASNIEISIVQPAAPYPTQLQANGKRYWDQMVEELGPEAAPIQEVYGQHIEFMLSELRGDETLDPWEVPNAVIGLANMPFGSRPGRLAIGMFADGIEPVNAVHDAFQADLLSHSAIADLVTPI